MKLSELTLTEGLIKLPPSTLKALHAGLNQRVGSYIHAVGKKERNSNLTRIGLDIANRGNGLVTVPRTLKGGWAFDVPVNYRELPTSYQALAKLGGIKRNKGYVTVVIYFDDEESNVTSKWPRAAGVYDHEAETGPTIYFSTKDVRRAMLNPSPDHLYDILDRMETTGEHELTHHLQFTTLRHGSAEQVRDTAEGMTRDEAGRLVDKYLASPVEFDPTLRSQVKEFTDEVKLDREHGFDYDPSDAVKYFVGAIEGKKPFMGFLSRSAFFAALKRVSRTRWEKAVKLFTTELRDRGALK